ncbi:hypothetical protein B1R42_09575 [Trueperella pyogenes]|nr:hypothetical protein B1R42_09575 [Trueperella pyogenes]
MSAIDIAAKRHQTFKKFLHPHPSKVHTIKKSVTSRSQLALFIAIQKIHTFAQPSKLRKAEPQRAFLYTLNTLFSHS